MDCGAGTLLLLVVGILSIGGIVERIQVRSMNKGSMSRTPLWDQSLLPSLNFMSTPFVLQAFLLFNQSFAQSTRDAKAARKLSKVKLSCCDPPSLPCPHPYPPTYPILISPLPNLRCLRFKVPPAPSPKQTQPGATSTLYWTYQHYQARTSPESQSHPLMTLTLLSFPPLHLLKGSSRISTRRPIRLQYHCSPRPAGGQCLGPRASWQGFDYAIICLHHGYF